MRKMHVAIQVGLNGRSSAFRASWFGLVVNLIIAGLLLPSVPLNCSHLLWKQHHRKTCFHFYRATGNSQLLNSVSIQLLLNLFDILMSEHYVFHIYSINICSSGWIDLSQSQCVVPYLNSLTTFPLILSTPNLSIVSRCNTLTVSSGCWNSVGQYFVKTGC